MNYAQQDTIQETGKIACAIREVGKLDGAQCALLMIGIGCVTWFAHDLLNHKSACSYDWGNKVFTLTSEGIAA